jgi:transketolase
MGEQVTYSLSEAVQETTAGTWLTHLERSAFDAVRASNAPAREKTALFAQMARLNTLYMVARAGSGHLGSSFSSMDIVCWLYLNVLRASDRYFSSKGHDAPGLYAVQTALGVLPYERIHQLRRLDGLPGHPDVCTPGAFTNTGSLGMGVSKAKGFLFADDLLERRDGRVYVMTGDGELQEGQFWESLATASRRRDGRLHVIVDHNKIQSDTFVADVNDLGDLEAKFRAFGWDVTRCDGHDLEALEHWCGSASAAGRPRVLIADTIKGRGVSFMEHTSMATGQVYYKYHSGAPAREEYLAALEELGADIQRRALSLGIAVPSVTKVEVEPLRAPAGAERMVPAYTDALMAQARGNPRIVALDADLVLDTGLIPFKEAHPERFVECGIAEQDMVSQAGTMALAGLTPIVHSFSCFLTTRPSEQIYNNCTEDTKVIYVGTLAGVLPAGPGHSHQSVRDVTAMSALPGLVVLEPLCAAQVGPALDWALDSHDRSSYLRLTSIPYETRPELQRLSALEFGRGHVLRDAGRIAVIVTNPVLLVQVLGAAERLQHERGIDLHVIATPWLNRVDVDWYAQALDGVTTLVTVENQYRESGFGAMLVTRLACAGVLAGRRVEVIGLDDVPPSGRNDEVLARLGLDAAGLEARIAAMV